LLSKLYGKTNTKDKTFKTLKIMMLQVSIHTLQIVKFKYIFLQTSLLNGLKEIEILCGAAATLLIFYMLGLDMDLNNFIRIYVSNSLPKIELQKSRGYDRCE
jgi:hypothetical protein